MTIKILTTDDLPMLKTLIGTGPQKIGFSDTQITSDEYFNYLNLCLTHPLHKTYAYINEENELVSYLTLCDFPGLPYYANINFKVIKKFNTYRQNDNGIRQFQEVYFNKEKENRYAFFKMRGLKSIRMEEKLTKGIAEAMPEFFNRYHRTIEEYIPAGQASKYEPFNKILLRGHKFNSDCVVYKYTCKQEFRNNVPEEIQQVSLQLEKFINRE
jgi:hypothetical protein